MMPKNPQNIVANMHASNTEIACWIRIEKEEKGQGSRGDKQNWDSILLYERLRQRQSSGSHRDTSTGGNTECQR